MNRPDERQRQIRRARPSWSERIAATPTHASKCFRNCSARPPAGSIGIYPIPPGFKLSVVIPVYNEERWLARTRPPRAGRADPEGTDPRQRLLAPTARPRSSTQLEEQYDNVRVFHQPKNMGKGAALREGFKHCTGDVVIVQDADLEYDPAEYPKLIQPILDGRADVVFGSRFIGESHRVLYYWHSVANKVLTLLSNMFTNLNLTDMETCYKVFRREVIQGMTLEEQPVRLRAGGDGEDRPQAEGPAAVADLRGADQLLRPHLRGRQEDRPEGRLPGLYCIVRYWAAD